MARDLSGKTAEEKYEVYDRIEAMRLAGRSVRTREDPSGFPAIRVYVGGRLAYLTDCLSLEEWRRVRTGTRHFIVSAKNLPRNYGVNAVGERDAIALVMNLVGYPLVSARAKADPPRDAPKERLCKKDHGSALFATADGRLRCAECGSDVGRWVA